MVFCLYFGHQRMETRVSSCIQCLAGVHIDSVLEQCESCWFLLSSLQGQTHSHSCSLLWAYGFSACISTGAGAFSILSICCTSRPALIRASSVNWRRKKAKQQSRCNYWNSTERRIERARQIGAQRDRSGGPECNVLSVLNRRLCLSFHCFLSVCFFFPPFFSSFSLCASHKCCGCAFSLLQYQCNSFEFEYGCWRGGASERERGGDKGRESENINYNTFYWEWKNKDRKYFSTCFTRLSETEKFIWFAWAVRLDAVLYATSEPRYASGLT